MTTLEMYDDALSSGVILVPADKVITRKDLYMKKKEKKMNHRKINYYVISTQTNLLVRKTYLHHIHCELYWSFQLKSYRWKQIESTNKI